MPGLITPLTIFCRLCRMQNAEVRPSSQFEQFPGERGDDGALSSHLLVQITDGGLADEHFRVALTGSGRLTATFNVNLLLSQPQLAHFEATVEKAPAAIRFKTNTFVSKWENLDDLVAAEALLVSTDEAEDAEIIFRAAWRSSTAAGNPPAALLRWSLQGDADHGFDVVLQALPASPRTLRGDSRLTADACKAVELARWPAACPMVEGLGPRALLFANNPGEASANIHRKPEKLEKGKSAR